MPVKREQGAARGLAQRMGIPGPMGGAHMELNGNREAVVEGCGGILEYSEESVRVRTGKLAVRFVGRGLRIKCLAADSLVVEGFFTGIEFLW